MSGGDLSDRLRTEVGRLTASPPGDFVTERTARVKALRAAGEADLARELAGQRRPTVPAWAADQLAHRHTEDLEALFAAADEVRRAQSAREPDRIAVREATGAFTAIVRRLRTLAGERLTELGTSPDSHLDDVEATLLAAATDAGVAADLRAGALLRPAPSPGFAALASLSSPERGSSPAEPAADGTDGSGSDDTVEDGAERAAERAAAEARRARRDELTAERERARAEAEAAVAAAEAARQRAAELRAEATRLEEQAAGCEDEAERADATAERARRVASETDEELATLDVEDASV